MYRQVWVVTDIEASGLVHRSRVGRTDGDQGEDAEGHDAGADAADEAEAEVRRQERRRVIANNKAWASAETVRREWLTGFVARKTAPKGAESLICEAVVTGHHTLSKAMEHRHPMLFGLLGIDMPSGYYGAGYEECHKIATRATTPKAATMTTLAAVSPRGRTPSADTRGATPARGTPACSPRSWRGATQPSDVERLLIGEEPVTEPAESPREPADEGATRAATRAATRSRGRERARPTQPDRYPILRAVLPVENRPQRTEEVE